MADSILKIDTHIADALNRLLEQYKNKPKTEGLISALSQQFQDMEDVTFSLILGREISSAVGAQLDLMGTIVNLSRASGQSDDRYRTLLYVKVGQNTSQGAPEKLISIYKLLTDANTIFYQNLNRASIMLTVDKDIDPLNDPDDVTFIYTNLEDVAAGGVRIDYLSCFSPDGDSFAFAGPNTNIPAFGFSNTITPADGGKLAKIHRLIVPFSFDGLSSSSRGFSSVLDPLVGGTLVTT